MRLELLLLLELLLELLLGDLCLRLFLLLVRSRFPLFLIVGLFLLVLCLWAR